MTSGEQKIVPVILSGGGGTRLWPASRQDRPKQFLPLVHGKSTFLLTLERIADQNLFTPPLVVTAAGLQAMVADELQKAGVAASIVMEPLRRDSGPAIAVAAATAERDNPGCLLLVLAADHIMSDNAAFVAAVCAGREAAGKGHIVTFGIKPSRPASTYGYIEPGPALDRSAHAVSRFVEKPDASLASRLIDEGCLWNSGNFLFRPESLLAELKQFEPAMLEAARAAVLQSKRELQEQVEFEMLDSRAFAGSPARSFDYAVMERTRKAAVVPVDCGWSDLGSFDALWEISAKDTDGNAMSGTALLQGCRNSYVSSDGPFTLVVGLHDVAVVTTPDAVLVAPRKVGAEIKTALAGLGASPELRHLLRRHAQEDAATASESILLESTTTHLRHVRLETGATLSIGGTAGRWLQLSCIAGNGRLAHAGTVVQLGRGDWKQLPPGDQAVVTNSGAGNLELLLLKLRPEQG